LNGYNSISPNYVTGFFADLHTFVQRFCRGKCATRGGETCLLTHLLGQQTSKFAKHDLSQNGNQLFFTMESNKRKDLPEN